MERVKDGKRGVRGVLGRLDAVREKTSRNDGCF
jgi:hypothetical protein